MCWAFALATGALFVTIPGERTSASPAFGAGCTDCHAGDSGANHPYDVDYAKAAAASGGRLRSSEEVVKRGLFLPDGKVQCLTCHDAASPWKHHLVLPPGAEPSPAVDPRDVTTYGAGSRRITAAELEAAAASGARPAITPKPLCLACHALD